VRHVNNESKKGLHNVAKVILTKGLPASGKTTWSKDQLEIGGNHIYKNGIKRVSKDDLRAMLDNGRHSKGREKFVLAIRDRIIEECLFNNIDIIVDDTNLAPFHLENITKLVNTFNTDHGTQHTVEIKDFTDVPLATCIERDSKRENPVGEKVIRTMYNQYLKPPTLVFPYDPDLPDAIICDLDGTLALLNGRNPYAAMKCFDDILNEPVASIVGRFDSTHEIILVSGRTDDARGETMRWLDYHGVPWNVLCMRKLGDNRKDSIVKQEILDNEIKGKYNVAFVLDDRDQVVEMWRQNGLTCLQVAEGAF
jgi:predicted kinase